MEYKHLGEFIREVNARNRELKVTKLMGISMTKKFRPSTSNVVGTDLSNYKIVGKNIFVFDTMSVIRVHKVPIAINSTDEPIIVSPAYHTFSRISSRLSMTHFLISRRRTSSWPGHFPTITTLTWDWTKRNSPLCSTRLTNSTR